MEVGWLKNSMFTDISLFFFPIFEFIS